MYGASKARVSEVVLQAIMMHNRTFVPRFSVSNAGQSGVRSSTRRTSHMRRSMGVWYGQQSVTVVVVEAAGPGNAVAMLFVRLLIAASAGSPIAVEAVVCYGVGVPVNVAVVAFVGCSRYRWTVARLF